MYIDRKCILIGVSCFCVQRWPWQRTPQERCSEHSNITADLDSHLTLTVMSFVYLQDCIAARQYCAICCPYGAQFYTEAPTHEISLPPPPPPKNNQIVNEFLVGMNLWWGYSTWNPRPAKQGTWSMLTRVLDANNDAESNSHQFSSTWALLSHWLYYLEALVDTWPHIWTFLV